MDFGAIWDAIVNLVGGAGDAAGNAASSVGGAAASAGSSIWDAIAKNPWLAAQTGLQGFNSFAPFMMGGGGGSQVMPDPGVMAQMQQPGGPTPQMIRGRLSDAQAQGLSGASPDFMAQMAGVTPKELGQMMGYPYGSQDQGQR